MPISATNGVDIYFETRGDPSGNPLIFIEGFTAQMIGWREGFLQNYVDHGFYVVILDNRDVGKSQRMGAPTEADGGYTLSDMAADTIGVLDTLGLASAHVAGQSMGGMIAQRIAIEHLHRVRSLTFFYTAPDIRKYRKRSVPADAYSEVPPRLQRDAAIAAYVERERLCGSPRFPFDEAWTHERGALSFDRGYSPDGNCRQFHAMSRMEDNLAALAQLTIPVAIIHGRDDALVSVNAAFDMAQAISTAEAHVYPGMGHELVQPLWGEFAAIVARTAARG